HDAPPVRTADGFHRLSFLPTLSGLLGGNRGDGHGRTAAPLAGSTAHGERHRRQSDDAPSLSLRAAGRWRILDPGRRAELLSSDVHARSRGPARKNRAMARLVARRGTRKEHCGIAGLAGAVPGGVAVRASLRAVVRSGRRLLPGAGEWIHAATDRPAPVVDR